MGDTVGKGVSGLVEEKKFLLSLRWLMERELDVREEGNKMMGRKMIQSKRKSASHSLVKMR